ncbi:MAG: hypothetical protein U1E54_01310 [Candidatus Levybacteria bacterium]|nr:hypothetical protein [Candidatus Levybacteria bacterium]
MKKSKPKQEKFWKKAKVLKDKNGDEVVMRISKSFKPEMLKQEKKHKDILAMIEKETYLATGIKSKKHWSGKCLMNDIIDEIQGQIAEAEKRGFKSGHRQVCEESGDCLDILDPIRQEERKKVVEEIEILSFYIGEEIVKKIKKKLLSKLSSLR